MHFLWHRTEKHQSLWILHQLQITIESVTRSQSLRPSSPLRSLTVETPVQSSGASLSLRYRSSLTWARLERTAFIPWALIPLPATFLCVLCSLWVCHLKLLWTRWMSKDKAIAQNHFSLEYRLHTGLWVKEMLKFIYFFWNKKSVHHWSCYSPIIMCCHINTVWLCETRAEHRALVFSMTCGVQRNWGQTFTLSLAEKCAFKLPSLCVLATLSFHVWIFFSP